MNRPPTNMDDLFDIRDVIERVEELEELEEDLDEVEKIELEHLTKLLEEVRGSGGDHKWRGHCYPVTFVNDAHFVDFAQDEAESLGLINHDLGWPYGCIDWEQAAAELQVDYTSVDFDGVTFWYRS